VSGPEVDFREVPPDHPDVLTLAKAMGDEISELYAHYELGPLPDLAAYLSPGDTALVGYVDGKPVTAGAVHRIDDEIGEIKRMYVIPDRRGQGVSRRLLVALEGLAARIGYTRMRLDTGNRQPRALALYRATGYVEIPDYNGNRFASYWFEKDL
jgi:GNAT superfamily N-acetyltransferase